MDSTVKSYICSVESELLMWKKGLSKIKGGTFKYDDSMPKSCVDALYLHKVQNCKDVLKWLKTLDNNLVISTNSGLTAEGSKYYELINR